MKKPPFTAAEAAYVASEIDRYKRTGHGIPPWQEALQHRDDDIPCRCHFCTGNPILSTKFVQPYPDFQEFRLPPLNMPAMPRQQPRPMRVGW